MEIFKKRETVIQNIAYMAIMSAINIIFVLLSNLVPGLLFLLVLILPLTSTVVTLYCKKIYYPVYAITTLGLCLAVAGGFSIFDALIYVFPSLIVGFVFGICFEKKLPAIVIIVGATVVQFGLSFLTYLVLSKIVTNFDIMYGIINLFGLKDFAYLNSFLLIFVYIISQIQIVLSYIFIKLQISRLGIEINLGCYNRFLLYCVSFISILLAVLSYFFFLNWTMIFVILPIPIYVFEIVQLILKRKTINYVLLGVAHIAFIFIFAFIFKYVHSPNQLITISVLIGLVTIIDFLDNYCFHKESNILK